MAKEGKNNSESMKDLEAKINELKKKKSRMAFHCSHRKHGNGKSLLTMKADGKTLVCEKCHTEFTVSQYNLRSLIGIKQVVHDVINQLKFFTISEKNNEDSKAMYNQLGDLEIDLATLIDMYDNRILKGDNNKNKNKNKDKDKQKGREDYGISTILVGGGNNNNNRRNNY